MLLLKLKPKDDLILLDLDDFSDTSLPLETSMVGNIVGSSCHPRLEMRESPRIVITTSILARKVIQMQSDDVERDVVCPLDNLEGRNFGRQFTDYVLLLLSSDLSSATLLLLPNSTD